MGLFNKRMKCPKCKGFNIEIMDNNRKSFSVGKALVGGIVSFGVGALAGLTGKKRKI